MRYRERRTGKEERPGVYRRRRGYPATGAIAAAVFVVAAAGWHMSIAWCDGGESATLRFSFRKDRPLVYRVRVRSTSSQVLTCGMQTIESPPQSRDVTFEMRLTPGDPEEGGRFPCLVSVGAFKGSAAFQTEDNRRATLRTDGTDVFVEIDGKVALDTSKGAGPGNAERLMRMLGFRGGEVNVVLDARGRKLKIEGDPVAARWFESASSAFFPALLPEKAVAEGESWEERVEISNLERFRLKAPMGATMRYELKPKTAPDRPAPNESAENKVASPSATSIRTDAMEIKSHCRLEAKDVEAEIPPALARQMSKFAVKTMTIDTEGTASFDREAGEFLGGYRKAVVRSEVAMTPIVGEEQVARVEGTVEMSYELIGAAGGKSGGGSGGR